MANLVWRFEGRLAVAVHSASDPSDLEWAGYLRDTLSQPQVSRLRVLVVSYGGGPTGTQRRALTDALQQPVPTAFLSNKWLARSLVNTLSWFNPKLRAFELSEDAAAFRFLDLTMEEQRLAQRLRKELNQQLGVGSEEVGQAGAVR